MSFDKQIQDKFSGFEPEVPEEHIDAGWEKIKYFLPQEEQKKRAFFFFRHTKGMGMVAVAALIGVMAFLLIKETEKTGPAAALQSIKPAVRTAAPEHKEHDHRAPAQHFQAASGPETAPSAGSVIDLKHASEVLAVYQKAKHASNAQLYQGQSALAKKTATTGPPNDIRTGSTDSMEISVLTSSPIVPVMNVPELMRLLKKMALDQEKTVSPEPELALLSADSAIPQLSTKRMPALELFSGLTNRTFVLQTKSDKNTLQAYGFSAGLGGIVPLKSRLYLSGQFVFCYNPLEYREETKANAIVKREVVNPVIISATNFKDTLIYYAPYTSAFELQSSAVYNLSVGAGYQLLSRSRISLDGALSIDFRWMRLNYRISKTSDDTRVFVNNISTPAHTSASFYESVEKSPAPGSASGKKVAMSFGINPYLNLTYRLNRKTALLLRPAYLIQLSPTALQVNTRTYQLKENNWFIHFGIRRSF